MWPEKESVNQMGVKLLYAGFETCFAPSTKPSTKGAGSKTLLESKCCAILIYNV